MAADVILNLGTGGDTVRAIDKSGKKVQVITLDVGGAGAETLVAGTVPVSGTVTANATLAAETTKVIGTVNIAAAQTVATVTTVSTVTALTGGGVAAGASDSGNPVKVGGRHNTTPPTLTDGQRGDLQLDAAGNLQIVGDANLVAAATGGYTPGFLIAANTMNATNVKASAGTLGFINFDNDTDTKYYVKLYNKASAPDPSADAALCVGAYIVPAHGDALGAGNNPPFPAQGMKFSTGIGFTITAVLAADDETVVPAGSVVVNYGYA